MMSLAVLLIRVPLLIRCALFEALQCSLAVLGIPARNVFCLYYLFCATLPVQGFNEEFAFVFTPSCV